MHRCFIRQMKKLDVNNVPSWMTYLGRPCWMTYLRRPSWMRKQEDRTRVQNITKMQFETIAVINTLNLVPPSMTSTMIAACEDWGRCHSIGVIDNLNKTTYYLQKDDIPNFKKLMGRSWHKPRECRGCRWRQEANSIAAKDEGERRLNNSR